MIENFFFRSAIEGTRFLEATTAVIHNLSEAKDAIFDPYENLVWKCVEFVEVANMA